VELVLRLEGESEKKQALQLEQARGITQFQYQAVTQHHNADTTHQNRDTKAVVKQLSKEEKLRREALLAQYGYQVEMTDENGDIVLSFNESDTATPKEEHSANDNSAKIAREDQNKRLKAKEQHTQLRDKEALKKDKEKKEKRKQATQKREKRRGCG